MSKIDNFVRFSRQDYPDAPEWFEKFSKNLNHILEQIVSCLQGRVSTANENAEVIYAVLVEDRPQEVVAPMVDGDIEEVRVLWSETEVTSFVWERTTNGALVTAGFSGSPTEPQQVRLKVRGA